MQVFKMLGGQPLVRGDEEGLVEPSLELSFAQVVLQLEVLAVHHQRLARSRRRPDCQLVQIVGLELRDFHLGSLPRWQVIEPVIEFPPVVVEPVE